jgi:hypothetical protein
MFDDFITAAQNAIYSQLLHPKSDRTTATYQIIDYKANTL